MKLKILSWNIWVYGQFDQIADFLKTSNADIICLQEVQADNPKLEVIPFLNSLGYQHVHAFIEGSWGGRVWHYGPAIFSKHKILNTQIYDLSQTNIRKAVRADVQIGDNTLHVFSVHLMHNHQKESEIQNEQIDDLIKVLPREKTIAMGDFNAIPDSTVIQKMKKLFIDSDLSSSPTWSTGPTDCPTCSPRPLDVCSDYIFTSKDLKTDSFQVENSKGSDHLAISLNIEI
jgi:endonuclease/exonuclease/phosphatase family metal-dependent hydrolase